MPKLEYDETGLPIRPTRKLEGMLSVRAGKQLWADVNTVMEEMKTAHGLDASITDALHYGMRQYVLSLERAKGTQTLTKPPRVAQGAADSNGGATPAKRKRVKG